MEFERTDETDDLIRDAFVAGLAEGFAGVPMDFPEGIRPIGEFKGEGIRPDMGQISPNLDDIVIDAEIIE